MVQPNGGGALTFIKGLLDIHPFIHPFIQQPTVVEKGLSQWRGCDKEQLCCPESKGAPYRWQPKACLTLEDLAGFFPKRDHSSESSSCFHLTIQTKKPPQTLTSNLNPDFGHCSQSDRTSPNPSFLIHKIRVLVSPCTWEARQRSWISMSFRVG